ncbi:MAG: hypothetical protein K9L66_04090 [Spirochaetaceae bacterium]|nr:hypothetical protein [Spirochaetaceae bacterium]MCF7950834.1 hypothetical protein [Spirochaetaceae bacterium]
MQHISVLEKRFIQIIALVAGVFMGSAMPLAAFSPTFIVGTSAEYSDYSEYDSTMWYDVYGIGSWRTAFDGGGYASLNGNATLEYNPQSEVTQDEENIDAAVGLPFLGGSMLIETGFNSTLDNSSYGSTFRPEWSGKYTYSPGTGNRNVVEPYIEYAGYYLYQELGTEDRSSHSASLGVSYDPSIKIGYRLEASGTAELYGESDRRDIIAAGEAEITGLAGYFADWSLRLNGGKRISNDEAYLADSIFGEVEGGFSWSPTRELQLSSRLNAQGRSYTDQELTQLDVGGSLEADWTPNDQIFFVLRGSAGKSFSNDPIYDTWNFSIGGGIEYGF